MSGVVKSVKKVFKSVVNVVKKIWKPLLIAAAVYFTAGLALAAFAPTAGFAASMPLFAGGGFAGLGVGTGATAGTGFFSQAAASLGLGAIGPSGGLVVGAAQGSALLGVQGATAAQLGAAGFSQAAIATSGAAAGASAAPLTTAAAPAAGTAGGIVAGTGPTTATAAPTAGQAIVDGALSGGATAPVAAKVAGMTLGEKILLASTGTQAVAALMGPDPSAVNKWRGTYYAVDYKGNGPGPVSAATAGDVPAPTPDSKQKLSQVPTLVGRQAPVQNAPATQQAAATKPPELFDNPVKNPKVRTV